jgi:hypothetical protein
MTSFQYINIKSKSTEFHSFPIKFNSLNYLTHIFINSLHFQSTQSTKMMSLLLIVFLVSSALATAGVGWKEYDSSIWCDVDQHTPVHHGGSTYCTLDMATTFYKGFCEMEYDAEHAYWLYGVGIIEPKMCKGAQYCQSVCWNYVGDQGFGLPPANFTVTNGTFPCNQFAVPVPGAPLRRTPINGSEDAIFCSLSQVGVNTTNGLCRLERNETDGLWSMISTNVCTDQVCAYTCLFSDQLDSELVFANFTGATEPGINITASMRYDFCALSSYTDDGSVTSSCQVFAHYVPGTDIAWAVTSGPNDCAYVCAEIWPKGQRPNSTTTTRTTTATAATTTGSPVTASDTTSNDFQSTTTATGNGGSLSSSVTATWLSGGASSTTAESDAQSQFASLPVTVFVPVYVESTPVWVWAVIASLVAAVVLLIAFVGWRMWLARAASHTYVQLPDTF